MREVRDGEKTIFLASSFFLSFPQRFAVVKIHLFNTKEWVGVNFWPTFAETRRNESLSPAKNVTIPGVGLAESLSLSFSLKLLSGKICAEN